MAEFIMKHIVEERGMADRFYIESCATSTEELGCDIYPPAKDELRRRGVKFDHRSARQMTMDDYGRFDYIVAMDHQNLRNLRRFVGDDPQNKVSLMMSYAGEDKGVADPWYTGNFSATFDDLHRACEGLLDRIND